MMKKPVDWDTTEAFNGDFKALTPGGHVCKILAAKNEVSKSGKEMLVIMFDIAEGDFSGYYADQYTRKTASNPDAKWPAIYRQLTEGNSVRFFKGMIAAIENSNSGYKWNWDESTLKNKKFGGVFGQEEYIDNKGELKLATKLMYIRSVEQVHDGVDIPDVKRLKQDGHGFDMNSFGTEVFPEEEIPF